MAGGPVKVEGTVEKLHEDHAKHCLSLANSMIEMNRTAKTQADLTQFEQEAARVREAKDKGCAVQVGTVLSPASKDMSAFE